MSFFKKLLSVATLGLIPDDSAEKAAREQARRAEEQLRKAQEAQKLQAANELQSVTTIANSGMGGAIGSDSRRRRRTAGAATSNLGLNV